MDYVLITTVVIAAIGIAMVVRSVRQLMFPQYRLTEYRAESDVPCALCQQVGYVWAAEAEDSIRYECTSCGHEWEP